MTERLSLDVNGTRHVVRSMIPTCRCSTRCGTSSASTIRASAAVSANAAPARCISTGKRCAPASRRSPRSRNAKITTLAGLGTPEKPHPLQAAWIEEQVNQCAYCINGWIMTGAELLARNPHPTEHEIKETLRRPDLPLRHPQRGVQGGQARRAERL